MPLVSVIMPVYNGAQYIEESIASVLNQSFRELELILVDDGSTDATREKVLSFKDSRIRYIAHAANKGAAQATCSGFNVSTGKYIALLDHDDIAAAHRLELQVRLLNGQPRLTIIGSHMKCFGAADADAKAPNDDGTIKANLLAGAGNVYNPTVMMRRDFIEKHSLRWLAEHKTVFDWGFYVNAMQHGARFANIPEALVSYRIHDAQQSKDQSSERSVRSSIRQSIMESFFPQLAAAEITQLEPLLQWVRPPALNSVALDAGLEVIPKALLQKKSVLGENRSAVDNFLKACQQRWMQARLTAARLS